jgi:phosphoribosylanthranilate isomerase
LSLSLDQKAVNVQNARVKTCGVVSAEDATLCANAGADIVGVIVEYPALPGLAPWNLDRASAAEVLRGVPPYAVRAAVVGGTTSEIIGIAEAVRPHVLELHGGEPVETVRQVVGGLSGTGIEVVKVFLVDVDDVERSASLDWLGEADRFLDAGATGLMYDAVTRPIHVGTRALAEDGAPPDRAPLSWPIIASVAAHVDCPVIVSGGLTPSNVGQAIDVIRPAVVDVIKAVEDEAHRKDENRIREFVRAASVEPVTT